MIRASEHQQNAEVQKERLHHCLKLGGSNLVEVFHLAYDEREKTRRFQLPVKPRKQDLTKRVYFRSEIRMALAAGDIPLSILSVVV
eukprot:1997451-Pleurochrysis_carterae.AAC.1